MERKRFAAGKFERGTLHFMHSKHLDVESPRPFQIGADNRNVVDKCCRLSAMVHGNCARWRNQR
jgi:hypothetical protein